MKPYSESGEKTESNNNKILISNPFYRKNKLEPSCRNDQALVDENRPHTPADCQFVFIKSVLDFNQLPDSFLFFS